MEATEGNVSKRPKKPTTRWDADRRMMHIEAEGFIVNIHMGLYAAGEMADCHVIEIIPDTDRYAGERQWYLDTTNPKATFAKGRSVRVLSKRPVTP